METHCKLCNINYSNRRSLLNHRRRFHEAFYKKDYRRKDEKTDCYSCKYCKKEYKHANSRWAHEKICKSKEDQPCENETQAQKLKIELLEKELQYKDEIIKLHEIHNAQISKLQNKLITCEKLDNKTFKAVNKILMDRSFLNVNINTTVNNTINNNFQILSLGKEELTDVLTMKEKREILEGKLNSIEKLIEIAHCGKYNQFKNMIITNLKDGFAYKYDETKGYFITVNKCDLLSDIITKRMCDIEVILEELTDKKKISEKTKSKMNEFIEKIEEDTPFESNKVKYENFRSYKENEIRNLLYNNRDKIIKDIAQLVQSKEQVLENSFTPGSSVNDTIHSSTQVTPSDDT